MSSDLNEAQAQQQLDELITHIESAFSRRLSNLDLDSAPEEIDQKTLDEVLDDVARNSAYGQANGPGNNATTSTDLSGSYGLAHLNANGKVFVVTNPVHNNYSGKIKIWGELKGRQAYRVQKLLLGYFAVGTIGLGSGTAYISTKREPKIQSAHGFGKWE